MTTQELEDQAGREELRTQISAEGARTQTSRELGVLNLANEYGGQPDDDGMARGRYAVVTSEPASENAIGDDVLVTTWASVEEACAHVADELAGCREWHEGIRDLDTGGVIEIAADVKVQPKPKTVTHRLLVEIETEGDIDPDAIGDVIAREVGDARSVLCGYHRGPQRHEAEQIVRGLLAMFGEDEDVKVNGLDCANVERFLAGFPEHN